MRATPVSSMLRGVLGKLALLLGSALLCLIGVEAAVRLELVPMPGYVDTDYWWLERWHREREGLNPREFVQLDRDLGFIPAANLDGIEYEGARVSTNSAHMRGTREYPLERSETPRVVAVGDSFTFGQCVDDDETYPAAIEEALGIEALNLGVMGYGHDQALLRLRRDGFPYKPDAVVFGFHHTDRRRNLLWFRGYSKPRFVFDEAGELVLDNVPTALPQDFLGLWPPRVWNLIQIARAKRTVDDRTRMRDANKLSKAILNQMAIDVQAQGIPLLVVFLPNMGALESDHEFGWKWLEKLCLATNKPAPFECVSPAPRLRQIAPKPAQMRKHLDCHYSPRFQREIGIVAAEKLAAMLGIQAPAAATEPAAPERPRKQRKKRRRRS